MVSCGYPLNKDTTEVNNACYLCCGNHHAIMRITSNAGIHAGFWGKSKLRRSAFLTETKGLLFRATSDSCFSHVYYSLVTDLMPVTKFEVIIYLKETTLSNINSKENREPSFLNRHTIV